MHTAAAWSGLALVMVGIGVAIASGPRAPEAPADPERDAEWIVADARAEARAIREQAP